MAQNASMSKKAEEVANMTPNWDQFTPAQKDSLFSYYYSISPATYQKTIVPLTKQLGNQNDNNIINQISNTMNAGAARFRGLRARRNEEQQMFLHGYNWQSYKAPLDVTKFGQPNIPQDITDTQ